MNEFILFEEKKYSVLKYLEFFVSGESKNFKNPWLTLGTLKMFPA